MLPFGVYFTEESSSSTASPSKSSLFNKSRSFFSVNSLLVCFRKGDAESLLLPESVFLAGRSVFIGGALAVGSFRIVILQYLSSALIRTKSLQGMTPFSRNLISCSDAPTADASCFLLKLICCRLWRSAQ